MLIEVRLLGNIEIRGLPGSSAELYRAKRLAALIYLLVENRPIPRLEIASLLWPEADERKARGSLNELLLRLRRNLPANAILPRTDDQLTLKRDLFCCDVVEIERAAGAGLHADVVKYYGGEFLPAFSLPESSSFDDWAGRVRARIGATAADSAWQVARGISDPREALRVLEICTRINPYDEAVIRRRLELTNTTLGTGAAIALYEETRQLFQAQLGVSVSPDTKSVINALLAAPTPTERETPIPAVFELPPACEVQADAHLGSPAASASKRSRRVSLRVASAVLFVVASLVTGARMLATSAGQAGVVDIAMLPVQGPDSAQNAEITSRIASLLHGSRTVRVTGRPTDERHRVRANLRSDQDATVGTIEVIDREGIIRASLPIVVSRRWGIDSVAAVAARFVIRSTATPSDGHDLGLITARQHVEAAFGDYSRGALGAARIELARAADALASIPRRARAEEWASIEARRVSTEAWVVHDEGDRLRAARLFGRAAALMRKENTARGHAEAARYRSFQRIIDGENRSVADSSAKEIRLALTAFPEHAPLWESYSALQLEQGQYREAISTAMKARELDPSLRSSPGLTLNTFMAAWNGGDDAVALAECDQLRQSLRGHWPSDMCALLANGWSKGSYDLSDLARRLAPDLSAEAPDANIFARLRLLHAAALAARGDTLRAGEVLALTPVNTDDVDLATSHLVLLEALGRMNEAAAWRSRIASLPAGDRALRTLSRALNHSSR